MDCITAMMKCLFNFKGEKLPNLSGRATLGMDRGYTRPAESELEQNVG